ncbi:MAG TPA: tetratricopeptide repeat protein, partial [Luteimonas sp.]
WDLYRAGDAAAALSRWREAGIETYNNPGWVPPTLALGLWTLDRREEAVQWYAAAVRTEPMHWRDPANLPALLPDWREEDRAKLAEVAAAWAKAPPSWP